MSENKKKTKPAPGSSGRALTEAQQKDKKEKRAMRSLGVARRSIWYILRTVLIVALCLVVCYGAFLEAMYVSNIYIIVTEGMELRADSILGNTAAADLREHFSEEWLAEDEELLAGKYSAFKVDSYDYRVNIEKCTVYPWSKKATLRVVERVVNIQATAYSDDNTDPVPDWTPSRIEIELQKTDGRWYITKLTVLEDDPEIEPRPTPDYSQLETDIPHY
ncbi:MAG: hypothetical protein IJM20_05745 [Clostridia bacterium]|nr:hypothetical protein [Clostridia bacterium]